MSDEANVWCDQKKGIAYQRLVGEPTADKVRSDMEMLCKALEGLERKLVLVDAQQGPSSVTKESRAVMAEFTAKMKIDKQAFIIKNPLLRMLTKTFLKVSGSNHPTAFFATIAEGETWLMGD